MRTNPSSALRALCLAALILTPLLLHAQRADSDPELSVDLMNCTFEIKGPGLLEGHTTFGTVFILGKPYPGTPLNGSFVLVTAIHVLKAISGDNAFLNLRRKDETGLYTSFSYKLQIRDKGKDLYTSNPEADVAAMYIALPRVAQIKPLTMAALVDDAGLEKIQIQPGDELLCLGFPLDVSLNGFPVLREGRLASYPITPSRIVKRFYYAFHVAPGNSGGPVYFSFTNRHFGGKSHEGVFEGVIGLVTQEVSSKEFKDTPLEVAVVTPSAFILDTIAMLPPETTTPAPPAK